MYYFWKIWWKLTGWKLKGEFPRQLPKMVLAVAPHTSWHDFPIGIAARSLVRAGKIRFLGKKELFDGPFGWMFRALGGTPVDRFSNKGMVEQVADLFRSNDEFKIAMAPEGTRKQVTKLRTGFYQIALQARVPIVMVGLDFGSKQVCFSEPFDPTGDEEKDMQHIIRFFAGMRGKYPEQGVGHLVDSNNV